MICRLCLKSNDFGKSHIIPEAFFKMASDPKVVTKIITNKIGGHPKKAPVGIYDDRMLCKSCERTFLKIDNYAVKLLRDDVCGSKEPQIRFGGMISYYDFDFTKFKLFTNSLLWRASVSTHPFYKYVQLGPVEEGLRQLVLGNAPGNIDEFTALCFQYDTKPELVPLISPIRNKFDGLTTYDFVFAGMRLCIKASFRAFQKEVQSLCVGPDEKLPLIKISYDGSNYKKLAKKIVDMQAHRVY